MISFNDLGSSSCKQTELVTEKYRDNLLENKAILEKFEREAKERKHRRNKAHSEEAKLTASPKKETIKTSTESDVEYAHDIYLRNVGINVRLLTDNKHSK